MVRTAGLAWNQLDAMVYIMPISEGLAALRVELVSPAAFCVLGCEADEFIRDPGLWQRLIHPDDVPRVLQQKQQILRHQEPRTESYRLRHMISGEYRCVTDAAAPFRDENGNFSGIVGIVRDITVERQTKRDLQMCRSQLEMLIGAVSDGVLVADNSGVVLKTNARVEQMLGWEPHELIGRGIEVLLPERMRKEQPGPRSSRAKGLRGQSFSSNGQLVALHKDGSEVPVAILLDSIPGPEGNHVLAIIKDVTEQRIAQEGLAFLSSIVKSSDDSIVGCDLDGVIVSWNRGAERLFGYTKEETIGKHMMILFPPDRHHECLQNIERVKDREPIPRYESRRVRKDGSEFDMSVIVSPIEDSSGHLLGMSAICRDITERRELIAALQVAKRTADEAGHVKSDFLAKMSHELRTPLNSIVGFTDVLLDSELSQEQLEYLNLVKNCAVSQLMVLGDILDIANIQSGKYVLQAKQFWLRDFVDKTMKEFEAAAQDKNIKLTWQIQQTLPLVMIGDVTGLSQILSKLVANAIKFTTCGEVKVTVEAPPRDLSKLSFSIRDSGIGIPVDQQRIIFEPFAQVDNSIRRQFGGTGLGLTACAKLVEIMGGRIWVDSDGHNGSTFHFTVQLNQVHEAPKNTVRELGEHPRPVERREPRRAVDEAAQMRVLRPFSPLPSEVRILDVSKGGLKVRVSKVVDPGALVQLNLADMIVVAEVRYCIPAGDQFYIGVEIVSSEASQAASSSET